MSVYQPYPAKPGGIVSVILLILAVPLLLIGVGLGRTVWGGMNLQYGLTPTAVEIRYGPSRVQIDRQRITQMQVLTPTHGSRRGGTAVPGLWDGHWYFPEIGYIDLFTTSTRLVVITTDRGVKWGISPVDPDAFVAAFRAGATGNFAPVPSHGWLYALAVWLGGILLIVGSGWLIVAIGRAPAHMRYLLDDTALTIRLWWIHERIPFDRITSVRLESPAGRPGRVWGTEMGNFYWGDFRWRQVGGSLKLYATRLKPIVLITTPERTYGITPAEDQALVTVLQQRIGQP